MALVGGGIEECMRTDWSVFWLLCVCARSVCVGFQYDFATERAVLARIESKAPMNISQFSEVKRPIASPDEIDESPPSWRPALSEEDTLKYNNVLDLKSRIESITGSNVHTSVCSSLLEKCQWNVDVS